MKSGIVAIVLVSGLLSLPWVAHAQTYSKTETIEYHDDPALWVMGQVKRTTTNGIETSRADYGWKALPWKTYSFGKLQQTLSYDSTSAVASGQIGMLKTVADGNNNVTTLSSWKRGVPQSIQYPATPESPTGATQSAIVNDNGWITSVTDENGFTTSYGYDAMGRMASIVYPTGDSTAWNTVTMAFQQINTDEHGLPAGHWRHSRYQGNKHVNTYYDAMWRPVLEEQLDAANIAGTLSQTVKRYDASGRLAFQSYPTTNVGDFNSIAQGTRTTYDALDRVKRVEQDSELGVLASTIEYQIGFKTLAVNPRGYRTLTLYAAYDQPTYDWPVTINQADSTADNASTDIVRDVFGKPTAIRRRNADGSLGVWRYYVYQADQQLCKTIEPEAGATVYGYDGASNLIQSASGLQGYGDLNSCNHPQAWASGRVVSRTYDARNRLKTLIFPDGNGNQSWDYTPDGLPSLVTTSQANVAPTTNTYSYNKRRLLTNEMTNVAGAPLSLGYTYDGNGSLSVLTYPNTLTVNYTPNALGQATQAGSYATGVQYYPNGAVKQFTYGNGITRQMTQNARQLPATSADSGAIALEYVYDANSNVQYIYDWVNPAFHRYLYYDGLDRLISAGSQVFGGDHWHRYTYDALDNLKSWRLAGVKDYAEYVYDAKNQLTNIKNSAGATVVGIGYDVQGNVSNKNGANFGFDYGNRLRGSDTEWYAYDAHGRRILSCNATACDYQQYAYDGKPYFHLDYRKGKRYNNIYLAGSVVAIREAGVSDDSNPQLKYQHTDALGSPVAVTDAAGTVIDRTNYEPYGAAINKPAYDGIGYTGHVMDGATGLTYMQQRYYDPGIGAMLSVDPVTAYDSGDWRQFNRYAYAFNNPYRFTDPDGRQVAARPEDFNNPTTIEQSAAFLGLVSDGLEAVDQVMTAMGPQGSGLSKLSVAPLARMAKPLAAEAKAAAQLAKNVAQGAKAEAKVAAELGAEVAGKRVTLEASTGQRSVADIVTKGKGVVEVKSGGATLSSGQKAVKADIDAGRSVTPRGQNAADAGLTPNQPVQMKCYDVKRC